MSPSTETYGSHQRQPAELIADRTIRAAAVDIDGTGVRSNKPVIEPTIIDTLALTIEPTIIDKLALTIPVTEHTAQARLIGRIRDRAICEPHRRRRSNSVSTATVPIMWRSP
jgi:hypothetical protein